MRRFVWRFHLAAIVPLSLAASPPVGAQTAGGRTVINGLYETVMDRVRPDPQSGVRTQQAFRVVLSGRNSIDESWVDQDPARRGGPQRDRRTVLGGSATEGQGQWRVAGASQLVRIVDYPQNQTVMTVTILGGDRCALRIEHRLKPGFSEFMLRERGARGWSYFSSLRATSAECAFE